LAKYVEQDKPDIIFIQETKASEPIPDLLPGYKSYWSCCTKTKGYSGVACFTKLEPKKVSFDMGNKEYDVEGRNVIVELEDYFIIGSYVPNAGQKLERLDFKQQWDKDFLAFMKNLEKTKPVIWCGDLNVAHEEIDIANPKTNKKSAGFTQQERDDFSKVLASGFVDVWRKLHPTEVAYTYWSFRFNARSKNIGWRLDYFVMSESLVSSVVDCFIRPSVLGSDHCPIGLLMPKKPDASTTS